MAPKRANPVPPDSEPPGVRTRAQRLRDAAQQRPQVIPDQPVAPPRPLRSARASTGISTASAIRDELADSVRSTTASQTAFMRDDDDVEEHIFALPSQQTIDAAEGPATATPVARPSSKALGKRPATDSPSEERPRRSTRFTGSYSGAAPGGDDADPDEPVEPAAEEIVPDADDVGIQVGKPARKARTIKEQDSISSSVADVRDLTEMQTRFAAVVEAFDAANDPELVYADKLRQYLANTTLLRYVAPYQQAEAGQLIHDFLVAPVPANARRWTSPDLTAAQQRYATGYVMQFNSANTNIRGSIPYAVLPQDSPQFDAHVRSIRTNVCEILRRWPYGIPNTSVLRSIIREVAHSEVGLQKLVNLPTWRHGYALEVTIEHTDPATRQRCRYNANLSPGVMKDVDIAAIPDISQVCKFDNGGTNATNVVQPVLDAHGNMVVPSVVPSSEGLNGQKAEKFLRYFAYRTHSQIVSKEGIRAQYDDLLTELGAKDRTGRSYGGSPLFYARMNLSTQTVRYDMSYRVAANISDISFPHHIATVRTLDGILASTPLEVGMSHFLSTGDPRIASLYLAETADFVNAEVLVLQPGVSGCTCDYITCRQRIHYCQSCLRERLCVTLVNFLGARICKRCEAKRLSPDDNSTASVPEAIMNASLKRSHDSECHKLGKDLHAPNEKKRYNDMVAWFKKHYRPNNVWFDDYISEERTPSSTQGVRASRDPFTPSGDAIEPYGRSHDLTMRVHTSVNMAMSTSGYNYMKMRQLIGFLQELAEYENLPSPHTPEQKEAFVKVCNDLYLVQMKTPWTKKARIQGKNPEDLRADQAEWRAGRPTNESGPWNLALWRWNLNSRNDRLAGSTTTNRWSQQATRDLAALSDEIQEHFGKQLDKNADGSPQPFGSWLEWNTVMEQRLSRMRLICNRHGMTRDSSQGLFAECIYQLCSDEKEYREFLDLPLSIYLRHPLCLSVAHKKHGQSMATGWPREPRRLSERDNELNNILFETWTSNTAKNNMVQKDCESLREDIKRFKLVRPELYDKTRDPDSAAFPKRNSRVKYEDFTDDDVQFLALDSPVEVDLAEEKDQGGEEDEEDDDLDA